jgi:hypothetical protein
MTAFELNAEVYSALQGIAGNENYMQQVLDFIKKLTHRDSQKLATAVNKIHVDRDKTLSLEKYLPLFDPSDGLDDDKLKEEYMHEKYKEYL